MLTYGIQTTLGRFDTNFTHLSFVSHPVSMESKEIPYVSMESKEIPYVSMESKEIPYVSLESKGRFDTNFTHLSFVSHPPSSYNLFIYNSKRGVPLEYFSFLNLCQTAVTPQVFQFIFKCIFEL
jgi:hypothetical protein